MLSLLFSPGEHYETYIDKNILRPLEMSHSYFDTTPPYLLKHRSHSYYLRDGKRTEGRFDAAFEVDLARALREAWMRPEGLAFRALQMLRRNPDVKWRQKADAIAEMQEKQSSILDGAARLLKGGGRMVYATCSLLDGVGASIVFAVTGLLALVGALVVDPVDRGLSRPPTRTVQVAGGLRRPGRRCSAEPQSARHAGLPAREVHGVS